MANKILPSSTKLALNTAFDKLLRIAGLPENYLDFSFADQINVGPYATTENMDLYVDPVLGNDSNIGTSALPFLTIQAAINIIPKLIRHSVVVHLAAGTYYADAAVAAGAQATVEIDGFTVDTDVNPDASLTVEGTMQEVLPAVTATSFTASTATSPALLTVSSASWTVSAYKNMFAEIISGTGAGRIFPIIDNTATQLQVLPDFDSADSTSVFHIINPVSDITDTLSGGSSSVLPYAIQLRNNHSGINTQAFSFVNANTCLLNVSKCRVNLHAGSLVYGVLINDSYGVGVRFSYITNGSSQQLITTDSSSAYIVNCHLPGNVIVGNIFPSNDIFEAVNLSPGFVLIGVNATLYMYTSYFGNTTSAIFLNIGSKYNDVGSLFNSSLSGIAITVSPGAYVALGQTHQNGTPTGFVRCDSGGTVLFSIDTTATAANFISLDHGATWTSKATIEAGTNKTIFNTSTGALAKEQ